jgi:ankyrin repeat protein
MKILLLAKNNEEQTACHLAADECKHEVLEKMWEWRRETVTAEELNNTLSFAKNAEGQTACHYASLEGNVEALRKLWEWGKDILTADELNNN